MALGYMAVLVLWNRSGSRYLERFRNAGRMALTNYLTQTVLELVTLGWLLDDFDITRTMGNGVPDGFFFVGKRLIDVPVGG